MLTPASGKQQLEYNHYLGSHLLLAVGGWYTHCSPCFWPLSIIVCVPAMRALPDRLELATQVWHSIDIVRHTGNLSYLGVPEIVR